MEEYVSNIILYYHGRNNYVITGGKNTLNMINIIILFTKILPTYSDSKNINNIMLVTKPPISYCRNNTNNIIC